MEIDHIGLVCWSLLTWFVGVHSVSDCTELVLILSLNDSMQAGDIVETFMYNIDVKNCPLLEARNKDLVLVNNTKNICAPEDEKCQIVCHAGSAIDIPVSWNITRKENYTLKFEDEHYTAKVYEESPINTMITIEPRVNVYIEECRSSGTKATRFFSVKDGSGLFKLGTQTRPNTLEVNGTLDYEQTKTYEIQLFYRVENYLGEGSTAINISVLDIDDENPTFDYNVYHLNVTENDTSTLNTELTTIPPIHAYDQDLGINTNIIYTIVDQEQNGLFLINNATGTLRITSLLDRENTSSYTIIIKAAQTDKSYRTATTTVIVNVEDIDDNIPVFQNKDYDVSINEHSTNGTIIVIVTATDNDQGLNANFTYKLKRTDAMNVVAVNKDNGEVTVIDSSRFDRESFEEGIINIEVETVPMNTSYPGDVTNVTIHLIDINDNNPNFTETNYIFEAVKTGDRFGEVFAEDNDEGPNANVTYHFIQSSKSQELCTTVSTKFPFTIDSISGNITVEAELFCERYFVMIEACDNPTQITMRRCSTASVIFNHNSTRETKYVSQTMTVSENSPINTTVDVIRCPGQSYKIQNGDNDFIVDTTTGLLTTNKSLDRENKEFHFLIVNVSSNGEVLCQVNVTIQVTDLNDNPPIFQNVTNYVFNLQDNSEIKIGEVHANDSDLGQNAEIMYYFQNKREGRFIINETTGDIFAANPANLVIDIVRLIVEVHDLGVPSLNVMEYVYILPQDQPPDLVPIISTLSEEEIEELSEDLKSSLQVILGTDITIYQMDTLEKGTMIQLKLLNQTYNRRTALATIVDNYDQIRNLFYTIEAKPLIDDSDEDEFGAAEIGLIVMALVVLIGVILAIVVVKKQCSRAEKYQHLYESLTRNSSIYESQEIKVKMEDDSSQLNGFANREEVIPSSDFVATATVNPAYYQDETNLQTETEMGTETSLRLQSPNSSETSEEEAMESLDQLSDRLEQEDGENGTSAVYAHVDVSKTESNQSENASINDIFLNENETEVNENCEEINEQYINHYENVPDNLATKVLQAKTNSPVLNRKHEDSDCDDVNDVTDDTVGDKDEPDPDYDNKQVRFTTEVLVADGIKVEPPSKAINDGETNSNDLVGDDNTEQQPTIPRLSLEDISVEKDNRDPGDLMLEEEISSPMDVLNDNENNDFFFGTVEETTHF